MNNKELVRQLTQIREENSKLYQESLELEKQIHNVSLLRHRIWQNNVVFENIINDYLQQEVTNDN